MIGYRFVLAVFAGVVLALPYLAYVRRRRDGRRAFGAGLVVAAFVYVVFAGFLGTGNDLVIEMGGLVLFGVLVLIGVRHSRYVLAAGWLVHVGWDLLIHPINAASYAPWWYPVSCIGFDLVVAGAILGSRRE